MNNYDVGPTASLHHADEREVQDEEDVSDLAIFDEGSNSTEGALRQEQIQKALKILLADGERCEGELSRADVNRTYLRRGLTIAECAEVETELLRTGIAIIEPLDDAEQEPNGGPASPSLGRRKTRYLTEAEEKDLGRRIQLAVQLETDGNIHTEYAKRVLADAKKSRDAFVVTNIRFVEKLARALGERRHLSLEDLIQEGVIGLLHATNLFDPERGFRFKTYAAWWIDQRMSRAIDDSDRTVRLPVHRHEQLRRIRRSRAKMTLENGRAPTDNELALALGVDPERFARLLWQVQATDCMEGDSPVGDDADGATLLTMQIDSSAASPIDILASRELQNRVGIALATLTPREERVIRMRFGLGLDQDYTLERVGEQFDLTRERIRQIEAKALKKLRHPRRMKLLSGFLESN